MLSTGSRVHFLGGERVTTLLSAPARHHVDREAVTSPFFRSSTLVKWASLAMGIATFRTAAVIFFGGRTAAHFDPLGVFHPELSGFAARQLAWQWVAATAILWFMALVSWIFWERRETARAR